MDGENVQPGAASEGAASTEGQQVTPAQPQAQPLTEERIAQLIAEGLEKLKPRIVQSVSDRSANRYQRDQREVADAQRRAQLAEEEVASLRASLNELDPQLVERASEKARAKVYSISEVEKAREREAQARGEAVTRTLHAYLAKEGIDPNDQGIDWGGDLKGQDPTDYDEGMHRFYDSVTKIKLEKGLLAAMKKSNQQAKDMELKLRKELGLDSVDTSTAGSGGGNSDDDFIRQMAEGKLPTTKENMARFKKITG